jgi:hypothetical protein
VGMEKTPGLVIVRQQLKKPAEGLGVRCRNATRGQVRND